MSRWTPPLALVAFLAAGAGLVLVLAPESRKRRGGHLVVGAGIFSRQAGAASIVLDPSTRFQTIRGWEPTAELGDRDFPDSFLQWRDTVVDLAVNDLGVNRVRLELRSGAENPVDHFSRWMARVITDKEWRGSRYEVINDNSNPNVVDSAGFHFSELSYVVDHVVLPLKSAVEANGEHLYINLCVVDFGDTGNADLEYRDDPAEYGEFVLAAFEHLQASYGWVPDGLEVVLEPDNSGWSGTDVGEALVAARNRLAAAGFSPHFTAPSTMSMAKALDWFDEMVQKTDAERYLTEVSYHRYRGVSRANLRAIAALGQEHGIDTAMLEHIGSGAVDLLEDLTLANASSWQQHGLAYPAADGGGLLIVIDLADPTNPRLARRSKYLRQYFRYVRGGAVRIAATTDDSDLEPVAFVHPDGRWVVVVQTRAAGSLQISGLPAGTYGVSYTLGTSDSSPPTQDGVRAGSIKIDSGESLLVQVPASGRWSTFGVVTVYGLASDLSSTPIKPNARVDRDVRVDSEG